MSGMSMCEGLPPPGATHVSWAYGNPSYYRKVTYEHLNQVSEEKADPNPVRLLGSLDEAVGSNRVVVQRQKPQGEKTMSHTPGPWTLGERRQYEFPILSPSRAEGTTSSPKSGPQAMGREKPMPASSPQRPATTMR